jgi:hypothetical protein
MRRLLCATAVAFVAGGCQHTPVFERVSKRNVYDLSMIDRKERANYVGQPVRVGGIAHDDRRLSGYLSLPDGDIYIDDLYQWPAELEGKKVTATGILIYHPKREPPENGGAYMAGPYYSLASATWSLAK